MGDNRDTATLDPAGDAGLEPPRAKKVLFVANSLGGGGAERVLVNLLDGLDRASIEPVCVFFESGRAYDLPGGVAAFTLGLRGLSNRRSRIEKLREIYRSEQPDAVMSFLRGVNVEVILAHRPFEREIRLIVSEHNRGSVLTMGPAGARKRRLVKKLYPRCDAIVAVSRAVKADLVEHFGIVGAGIEVIYNPVNTSKIESMSGEEVSEHPWFAEQVPIILNVGALKDRKGQEDLLRSFCSVRNERECRLVFMGNGEKEPSLRALAGELGLDDCVAFLPFQRNPFKFMARSSLFVTASLLEGFPNVILEAMACRLPVVSTRWLGADELIEHDVNGILVPVQDRDALSGAIINALDRPDQARMLAEKARVRIERFSLERVADLYTRLLVEPGSMRLESAT